MEAKKKCVYHRGDIVYVKDLPATGGHELCGNRPAVIISSNHLNRYSDVLIVVLLTSSNVSSSPVHIPVPSKSETSVAKCEQPKSIDRKFITVPIGHISREELYAIDKGIAIATGRVEYPKKPYKPRYKNHYCYYKNIEQRGTY